MNCISCFVTFQHLKLTFLIGSGTPSAASNQSPMPPGSTPPPHQPIGLAQAQTNNSNNKTDAFTQQLHRLVDNWAEGVRAPSRSRSLSLRPQQLTRSRIWSAIEVTLLKILPYQIFKGYVHLKLYISKSFIHNIPKFFKITIKWNHADFEQHQDEYIK